MRVEVTSLVNVLFVSERWNGSFPSGGGNEACSSCRPKARCLRRPVIRADVEFRIAVPSAAKEMILVGIREQNVL